MQDFDKIIKSLYVKFSRVVHLEIRKGVSIDNYIHRKNTLILVNRGCVNYGQGHQEVNESELLFIPSKSATFLKYGSRNTKTISMQDFDINHEKYFSYDSTNPVSENMILLRFDAKVFESVNFFHSTGIPAFKISDEPLLAAAIRELEFDARQDLVGKEKMITINTERIVILLLRHIANNNLFEKQLNNNINYFKDPRLLDILNYIKENLDGDLSNAALSNVANVSEEYLGQFFKSLTGIKFQDYIEIQRMEKALEQLENTKKSVNEIAQELGYKDAAYFCRRFKRMYGMSASKMRKPKL